MPAQLNSKVLVFSPKLPAELWYQIMAYVVTQHLDVELKWTARPTGSTGAAISFPVAENTYGVSVVNSWLALQDVQDACLKVLSDCLTGSSSTGGGPSQWLRAARRRYLPISRSMPTSSTREPTNTPKLEDLYVYLCEAEGCFWLWAMNRASIGRIQQLSDEVFMTIQRMFVYIRPSVLCDAIALRAAHFLATTLCCRILVSPSLLVSGTVARKADVRLINLLHSGRSPEIPELGKLDSKRKTHADAFFAMKADRQAGWRDNMPSDYWKLLVECVAETQAVLRYVEVLSPESLFQEYKALLAGENTCT